MRALRLLAFVVASMLLGSAAWGEAPPSYLLQWGTQGGGNGEFFNPQSVAIDAAGNVYVVDSINNRIQKFTNGGVYITQWGSMGSGPGQFNNPWGVATGPAGAVYVADWTNNRIQKFTSAGAYVTQWGGLGSGNGQFSAPAGVATDAAGNVYVTDYGNYRVQKFTSAGAYITQWGSSGTGNGQFSNPWGVAVDGSSNVYVSDFTPNNRIQKFTSTGVYLTQWGGSGSGAGQFYDPEDVATDSYGNVYVADYLNARIQKFDNTGTYLTEWGTYGSDPGQFEFVTAVAVDATGNVFVSDYNQRIQKFGTLAISRLEPNRGGDGGAVTVAILGAGFQSGASVKLAHSGQSDIVGSLVTVATDGKSLTATFELGGRLRAPWDVVVTNPSLSVATLVNGFTVDPLVAPQLKLDIVAPPQIRASRRTAFDLVIENRGNVDAFAVPLWIAGIPTDATVEAGFTLTAPPQAGGEPDWTTAPFTFTSPGGRYAAVVIPRIPPGTLARRVYLTVPATDPTFSLRAAVSPTWVDGTSFRGCLIAGGVITNAPCMATGLSAINADLAGTSGIEALNGIGVWSKIAWGCEGASTLPASLAKAEQVLDFMVQPVDQLGSVPASCGESLSPRWWAVVAVGVVSSLDPNAKFGAQGVGVNRALSGQQAIPYSVRFENLSTATAPAQQVVVVDPVDLGTLDPNSLSLDTIIFGNVRIVPPPGLSSYAATVDLRPNQNLLVYVAANLDPFTGVVTWYFNSIDPATGQPPTNPLVGFLPPNTAPPAGEGSVLFTMAPRAQLATGTQISNGSAITFDSNAPLNTLHWINTVDNTAPASHVLPLGANSDSATFTVHWTATGSPPDLRDFTIYVAEDGGSYRTWRPNTIATADTFAARPKGHTYAFYSVARDSSGNVEAAPGAPDAQTYSRLPVEESSVWQLGLEAARPNPAVGTIHTWFSLPSRDPATLELIDVTGRRVAWREVGSLGPGRHTMALGSSTQLRPGLYFLRLTQNGRVMNARAALVR
jgi:hypothetical protein